MHLNDDLMRSYLDHQLTPVQILHVEAHVAGCAGCAGRLERIQSRMARVQSTFNLIAPDLHETALSPQKTFHMIQEHRKETIFLMITKRPLLGILAALVALVLVFTLTPASAWASSFLGLFRVQKITVVSFDPAALQKSQDALSSQSDAIHQVFKNDLVTTKQGKEQKVNTADEAAKLAGFTPRLLAGQAQMTVKPGEQAKLTIDQPKFQALLDAVGVNTQLPKEVNGKVITFNIPSSVTAAYGDCPTASSVKGVDNNASNCAVLMQLPSPTVDAPAELNISQIGEAMFQFLGLPESQAHSLSQSIDWATTLVLPIPQGEGITYQDVQVDGVKGTLLVSTSHNLDRYALVWTKNGMVYALNGLGGANEALQTASTLH